MAVVLERVWIYIFRRLHRFAILFNLHYTNLCVHCAAVAAAPDCWDSNVVTKWKCIEYVKIEAVAVSSARALKHETIIIYELHRRYVSQRKVCLRYRSLSLSFACERRVFRSRFPVVVVVVTVFG